MMEVFCRFTADRFVDGFHVSTPNSSAALVGFYDWPSALARGGVGIDSVRGPFQSDVEVADT